MNYSPFIINFVHEYLILENREASHKNIAWSLLFFLQNFLVIFFLFVILSLSASFFLWNYRESRTVTRNRARQLESHYLTAVRVQPLCNKHA